MRCLITPLAIVIALAACVAGATSRAQGGAGSTNAGPNAGAAGVAGTPALPPPPAPAYAAPLARALAPTPPPAPVPALVPGPGLERAPVGQARGDFGNPGAAPLPIPGASTGISNNVNAAVAANPGGEQWRYRWQNGNLSYWTPENRWVYRIGNQWTTEQPAIPVAAAPVYVSPPAYGYSAPGPYGYYPTYATPYGYSAGYGGYYNYGPGYHGGYYGPGAYYGAPGISIGTGRGGGIHIGF